MVKEATGQDYLAADFAQFPIGVRLVLSLMWQQGENIFTDDGTATIDTEAARNAVTAITQLFDAGHANPQLNYADSQQAFLNGEAAVLVNGTWVVDFYAAEAANPDVALSDYYVADFPTLFDEGATWADSHMWAIPASVKRDDPETYAAALRVLAFINDHNIDWARTGHMAVRNSVLESEAYAGLPHRDEYTGTAAIARDTPAAENYGAIQDVLNRELQAIWLTGKPIDDALSDAELDVQDLLDG
jgi:multiple sugar transport system substrate-binding protein